jgi:hypothetical protein
MVRYALPSFTNNWLVLIKATALVSLIGLHDMTYLAKQSSAAVREPFAFFLFAAALYLVFTSLSLRALRAVSRATAWARTRCSCYELEPSSSSPTRWRCTARACSSPCSSRSTAWHWRAAGAAVRWPWSAAIRCCAGRPRPSPTSCAARRC